MTQSNKPVSRLRQRMLEDMAIRKLGPKTRKDYIRAIVQFTRYLKRSPDSATAEDLREFQLHLTRVSKQSYSQKGSHLGNKKHDQYRGVPQRRSPFWFWQFVSPGEQNGL